MPVKKTERAVAGAVSAGAPPPAPPVAACSIWNTPSATLSLPFAVVPAMSRAAETFGAETVKETLTATPAPPAAGSGAAPVIVTTQQPGGKPCCATIASCSSAASAPAPAPPGARSERGADVSSVIAPPK